MKNIKANDLKPCWLVLQYAEVGDVLQKLIYDDSLFFRPSRTVIFALSMLFGSCCDWKTNIEENEH